MTIKYQLKNKYVINYIDCDKVEIDYDTIAIYQNGKSILEDEISEFQYLEINKEMVILNGELL